MVALLLRGIGLKDDRAGVGIAALARGLEAGSLY
jgi:hypothetical protein